MDKRSIKNIKIDYEVLPYDVKRNTIRKDLMVPDYVREYGFGDTGKGKLTGNSLTMYGNPVSVYSDWAIKINYKSLYGYTTPLPFKISNHSTHCCGSKSIYFHSADWLEPSDKAISSEQKSAYNQYLKMLYDAIKAFDTQFVQNGYKTKDAGLCFDCTLSSSQETLKKILINTFGFKEVYQFKNCNSNRLVSYLILILTRDYEYPELVA